MKVSTVSWTVVIQVLLLFGNKRASRGQSALHQFGEGRAKYFFSTIVATMLFFGGAR